MMQMQIIRGQQQSAKKVVIYGPEGIGKSTFASHFPSPVFIDVEGSTTFMDVDRTPKPSSFAMLLEQIRYFVANPHLLRTLVIDTADWAEKMCIEDILLGAGKRSIEDFGYGKGYTMAYEQFGSMLNLCTTLVDRGVNVVITAHAWMRKFEQPDELGSYDRWELKLGQKTGSRTAPVIKEWADILLFANYKTYVVNVDDQGAAKGKNKVQGGKRVMFTAHHVCWDAKNRFGLAEELPFDYAQIAHLFDSIPAPTKPLQSAPVTPQSQRPAPVQNPADPPAVPQSAAPAPQAVDDTPILPSDTENHPAATSMAREETDEDGIPQALLDLMHANGVKAGEIQFAVHLKGYFPNDTPIRNYPLDFVNGVLIAAWPQVYGMVQQNRKDNPFYEKS